MLRKMILVMGIIGLVLAGVFYAKDFLSNQFTTVMVARIGIEKGALITADMMQPVYMHKTGVHPLAINDMGSVSGKVAAEAIEPGEQFLPNKLGTGVLEVPPNLRLTLLSGEILGTIGGFMSVGDIIDIGVKREDGTSRLVLTNISVVYVTDETNNPTNSPSMLSITQGGTMSVTPGATGAGILPAKVYIMLEDAYQKAELNKAEQEGKLYILLHSRK